jgi:hypothetical protein
MIFFGLMLLIVVPVAMYIFSDAKSRGLPPFLTTLLIVFTFPLGALLWLLLRPAKKETGFDLRDFRAQ